MTRKKVLLNLLKIAVTLGLVLWLVEHVDWRQVLDQILNLSLPLLLLYIFCQLLGNVISAYKWQMIAAYKGLHFRLKEGFFAYLTGAFVNNFLPSTIGGDAYRGLWLSERYPGKAVAFSTVVFDRFTGLWSQALLGILLAALLGARVVESAPLIIALAAMLGFLAVNFLLTAFYRRPWFHRLIERIPFDGVRRLIEEEMPYALDRKLWWRTIFWASAFAFVGLGLANFVLFRAVGSDIGFLPFLSVIFTISIIAGLPISINNIGVKEWAYVTFFGLVGLSVETAVTVSLLSRFFQMCISFGALPYYLTHKKASTAPEAVEA
jgi:uncharacterized protein (TIRG00374 family)